VRNLRAGIDTPEPDYALIAKLSLPFDDQEQAIAVLRAIEEVRREKMAPARTHAFVRDLDNNVVRPRTAVEDLGLNLLVAFGLTFFLGDIDSRPVADIPNFPPGGTFPPRLPTRFGINRHVPLYLRTMNADGDRRWLAINQPELSETQQQTAYLQWLREGESDLLLWLECDNQFLVVDFWDALRQRVVEPYSLKVATLEQGFNRQDGRDHTGWLDGISNMQDLMNNDPYYYRSKVYLPHPAPNYPGEPTENRDDPIYDGGTYMVHRKYVEHLDRWRDKDLAYRDADGYEHTDTKAREEIIGRERHSGAIIARRTGKPLEREPDSTEVSLAPPESHILKARGGPLAPFIGPFPPLAVGSTNVFHTQDVRIRRRGINFCELDPRTGKVTYGLHFVCFQNNIQQTGFEFINNIWLINPLFRGRVDSLLDPERGFIEPIYGCYYFVPPEHREYPGEVFFL
jgi:Dyp-type peroxidase family